MITVREMTREDCEEVMKDPLDEDMRFWGDVLPNQPSLVAENDGRVIGVGGIAWFWEGVGEAWVVFNNRISNCKFGAYRMTRLMFKELLKHHDYKRIQATVRVNWKEAVRMVEKLGFKREGEMKNYCPNGDAVYMYSITKD